VVTGLGLITPLGATLDKSWAALMAGKSGIGPITRFDAKDLETRIAGEVHDFDPLQYMDRKEAKRADRFAQFAVATAGQALADGKLEITKDLAPRIGVTFGSGIGGVETLVDNILVHEKDPRRTSPFMIPMMIMDMAAGEIAMKYGAKGPNLATVSACASSAHAIGEATDTIRRGQADVMLAGGSEAGLIKVAIGAFNAMHALSRRNDEPEKASRPFDTARDGFVLGEGAGIMVLERREFAEARGAKIYGRLAGIGTSADGYHITAPDPEGVGQSRAIAAALRSGNIDPSDVGHVNCHATSTPVGDVAETVAIRKAIGDHPVLTAPKGALGHLLGAAGAVEAIVTVLSIRDGVVPQTLNLENLDPAVSLDVVAGEPRKIKLDAAVNDSFGFGGHNVALVFTRN